VLKLLPKATLGANEDGSTQSFILEKSIVDVKQGWMHTDSRNLDWNNVLSVIERQTYRRPDAAAGTNGLIEEQRTDVDVSVTLKSRIGEQIRKRRQRWGQQATATSVMGNPEKEVAEEEPEKAGWFNTWTSGAIRSAVETISLQRTEKSQPKAQKGMSVVLARLRSGGLEAVLEGMRADREVQV
jgi:hypothetical protein